MRNICFSGLKAVNRLGAQDKGGMNMKQMVQVLFLLAVAALLSPVYAADELEPGLNAEFFDLGAAVEDFPTIAKDKKANVERIDKKINYETTEEAWQGLTFVDHFYARWTGVLQVAKAGKYTFFLESDDGSRLFIDGKEVVTNGGLHGMDEKSGDVELTAGPHDLKVEFFENDGGAGCIFSWQGGDIAKQVVPETVLFHKKGTAAAAAPGAPAEKK
jgi:hypothetical protein